MKLKLRCLNDIDLNANVSDCLVINGVLDSERFLNKGSSDVNRWEVVNNKGFNVDFRSIIGFCIVRFIVHLIFLYDICANKYNFK
jgi:hypothetical protein